MPTSKTTFLKKMINCIKNIEKYPEMATAPLGQVISYFIKIILIFTLVAVLSSLYGISKNVNMALEYFKNNLPDVNFTNNELIVDSKDTIEIKPKEVVDLIIINTNQIEQEELDEFVKKLANKDSGIIFLRDRMIINAGTGNIEYNYAKLANTYNISNMTKESIINCFSGSNLMKIYCAIFIISYISFFIAYTVSITIDAIALGILGYITALVLRLRLKFIAMIKLAMYALTLPILLNLLYVIEQALFGYNVKYFEVMYITIAYIYIISSILMIKSDFIRRGQELTQIIEEEKKVKEELEKEKEEEERRKEEDRKKEKNQDEKEQKNNEENNEKENKKRKKEEEENQDSGNLQGDNA